MIEISNLLDPAWFTNFMGNATLKAIFVCPDGNFIDVTAEIGPYFLNGCLNQQIDHHVIGDPCPKNEKYLIVWYKDLQGDRKTVLFKEDGVRHVIGRCPHSTNSGWIWPLMY
jgi:hypothetical protein